MKTLNTQITSVSGGNLFNAVFPTDSHTTIPSGPKVDITPDITTIHGQSVDLSHVPEGAKLDNMQPMFAVALR